MTNLIVETRGDYQLVDPATGSVVHYARPSVVVDSSFIQDRSALGYLKILGEVPGDLTDEEFEKQWKDKPVEATIQAATGKKKAGTK